MVGFRDKYSDRLQRLRVPEWSDKYLDYDALMDIVTSFHTGKYKEMGPRKLTRVDVNKFKDELSELMEKEFDKIHTFLKKEVWKNSDRYKNLVAAAEGLEVDEEKRKYLRNRRLLLASRVRALHPGRTDTTFKDVNDMKEMEYRWSEFYIVLQQLRNYADLNHEGFKRILDNQDKLLGSKISAGWLKMHYDKMSGEGSELRQMIKGVEKEMERLTGSRTKAMEKLKMPRMAEKSCPVTTFRVGLYLGAAVICCALCAVNLALEGRKLWARVPVWLPVRLYRGWLAMFLHILGFAANIYVWQQNGVNRALIFSLDPRDHLTYQGVLEIAVMMLAGWSLSLLCFISSHHLNVSPMIPALLLYCFPVLWLILPFPVFYHKARLWSLRKLLRSIIPYKKVTFIEFWLMDQLTSQSQSLSDIKYGICVFARSVNWTNGAWPMITENITIQHGDPTMSLYHSHDLCSTAMHGVTYLVAALPYLCRFAQCIRRIFDDPPLKSVHGLNAFKYMMSVISIALGAMEGYFYSNGGWNWKGKRRLGPWMLVSSIRRLWKAAHLAFLIAWDLAMDWGLLRSEHMLLRERLVFSRKGYYYSAMVLNSVCRFLPMFYLWIGHGYGLAHELVTLFLVMVEVGRRLMWNIFRLENEHFNNVGHFRTHRDISFQPFKPPEQ